MQRFLRVFLACVITVGAPNAVIGQDVKYTTVTKAEFGGALGRMIRVMPGANDPVEETTYVKGNQMRVDDDESSTIMNMESRAFTLLNHPEKSYFTMEWGDLATMWTAQSAQMEQQMQQQAPSEVENPEPEVHYEVKFDVDRTGDRERLHGYTAERVFMTLEVEATEVEVEDPDDPQGGTMVVLTELWMSQDFPGYLAMQEMRPETVRPTANGSETAFSFDPRIQEAMERLAEEAEGLEGIAMKTVSHFVIVPLGLDFDRDAVMRDADKSLGDDIVGAAASSVASSARSAIGGMFGRKKEPEAPAPQQAVIMRTISEITDVSDAALPDELFVPPPDYTLRTPAGMPANSGN